MVAIADTEMQAGDNSFVEVSTPRTPSTNDPYRQRQKSYHSDVLLDAGRSVKLTWIFYASLLVVLLQPFQFGWSISQLNLTTFHDQDDCDARPVVEGTCLMFPGHSKTEWTLVVNAWIVGGMVGSLSCGSLSERFGRQKAFMGNAVFMMAGAIVQASTSSLPVFMVGRFLAGIASGGATGMVGGYISEICPPHLRNSYGIGLQISFSTGLLLVVCTFFFANTSSGWRYIAGFPVVNAGLFLALAPFVMVESPAWLMKTGNAHRAHQELARLYGESGVELAMSWMDDASDASSTDLEAAGSDEEERKGSALSTLLSPLFRRQLLVAMGVASSQQLSGINAVFYYSSDMFKDAGISDARVGHVIVNMLMLLPLLAVPRLSARFGNRKLLLCGIAGMFISAAGMTLSLSISAQALSIVFTATYVGSFAMSLGPLIWSITAALFTDSVRATASSICIFCNWTSNLMVGVFFPYIADALDSYSFTVFMVILVLFFVFTRQCVPETVGKSSAEIQAEFRARREQNDPATEQAD